MEPYSFANGIHILNLFCSFFSYLRNMHRYRVVIILKRFLIKHFANVKIPIKFKPFH